MAVDSEHLDVRETAAAAADRAAAGRLANGIGLALFLACALGRAVMSFAGKDPVTWAWLDGLLVVLAFGTTLIGQAQRLPLQNVLTATALIVVIGGGVQLLGAWKGIPFGEFLYTEKSGGLVFGSAQWLLPMIWVVVILNGRGVARLVFRPWRKTRTYGFRIIGLTCVMAAVFDLGLDPLASRVGRYWFWNSAHSALSWYGAPWINFLGWLLTALLILAFTTPFLLNKKPQKSPPFFHPLIVWFVLGGVQMAGALANQLWAAAGLVAVTNVALLVFALRGARW